MTGNYATIAHMGGTILGGASEGAGTIVGSGGGPFVAGEASRATCVVYGKSSAAGAEFEAACASTGPSADKPFPVGKRSAGDVAGGSGGAGRLGIPGGTGKFEGVTGSCSYEADYPTKDPYVTRAGCTRQR